jgi:hypothetical protein
MPPSKLVCSAPMPASAPKAREHIMAGRCREISPKGFTSYLCAMPRIVRCRFTALEFECSLGVQQVRQPRRVSKCFHWKHMVTAT